MIQAKLLVWAMLLGVGVAALLSSNLSLPERVAYGVVLLVGVPAMLRNWTAVALVGSFLVVHLAWALAGERSLALDIICDYAVIIAVLVKTAPVDCIEREIRRGPGYGGAVLYALRRCHESWADLSRADKVLLALFAPAWACYAIESGKLQYWILWSVGLLQFFVAGAEAFATWHRGRAAKADANPAEPFLRWGIAANEC